MHPAWLIFLGEATYRTAPMFSLDADTFIAMIPNWLNLAVLALCLTYLLYKPVQKVLAARAERIKTNLDDAELSKLSANELKTLYEQKVKEIDSERASVLEEARKAAKDRQQKIVEEAKAEAAEIKDKAQRDIATEKDRIKDTVYAAIVDISTDMAAKLISANIDKSAHDKLFAEAMAELEATSFRKDVVA